jgi:hypothetical protein
MMQFLDSIQSKGIQNHFSTLKEQWPNGVAESTINSIMMIARTVMAESGLLGRVWFKAASVEKDARNVTYKKRIWMTQHQPSMERKETLKSPDKQD